MSHILLLAAVAFTFLATLYDPFLGDVPLILWVRGMQGPVVASFMDVVSWAGSGWLLFGLVGIVIVALFLKRRRRQGSLALGSWP